MRDCAFVALLLLLTLSCWAQEKSISVETIKAVKHSIVPIVCGYTDESNQFRIAFVAGSGFFVDTSGRFLTAGHVVDDWDAAMKKTHVCRAAIYVPDRTWVKFENDIPFQYFWFIDCVRDDSADLAVCQPIANPFTSPLVPKGNISAVVFDTGMYPDGTSVAFTGFPLENTAPITSIGFIAGGFSIPGNTIGHDFVIDKAAWPGASGSLLYLDSGKVIGIIQKGGRNDASGIGVARDAAIIVDFLSKHPVGTQKQPSEQK